MKNHLNEITQVSLQQEEKMRVIADLLANLLGPGAGFALLVFPFNGPAEQRLSYISNAAREDMIKALREGVMQLEAGKEMPASPNVNAH